MNQSQRPRRRIRRGVCCLEPPPGLSFPAWTMRQVIAATLTALGVALAFVWSTALHGGLHFLWGGGAGGGDAPCRPMAGSAGCGAGWACCSSCAAARPDRPAHLADGALLVAQSGAIVERLPTITNNCATGWASRPAAWAQPRPCVAGGNTVSRGYIRTWRRTSAPQQTLRRTAVEEKRPQRLLPPGPFYAWAPMAPS